LSLEPQLLSNERKWGEAELGWRAGSSVGAGHPSAAHGVAAAPLLLSLRLSRSRVSRAATSLLSQRTCTCTCTCTCTHPRRSVLTTDRGGARVASRGECGCGVCTSSLTAAALARVKAAHSPACVTSRAHRAVLRRLLLLLLLPRSQPHSQHTMSCQHPGGCACQLSQETLTTPIAGGGLGLSPVGVCPAPAAAAVGGGGCGHPVSQHSRQAAPAAAAAGETTLLCGASRMCH
jgi:hypothetical protein